MSAGPAEAVSTFRAAMETYTDTNRRQIESIMKDIEEKMGSMSETWVLVKSGMITKVKVLLTSGR